MVRPWGGPVEWWEALRAFRALRFKKRDQIEHHQSRLLQRLIVHAAGHVPYYRRLLARNGLRAADIRRPADLARLPILTRADVREAQDDALLADSVSTPDLVFHCTNGTTGYSLTIRRTPFEELLLQALRVHHMMQLGLRPSDVRAAVRCPDPRSGADGGRTWWSRLGLLRTEMANCLWAPEAILASLRAIQPDVISGYPGSLAWIATHLTAADRQRIRPRFLMCGGETMSPSMRRQISDAFRRPVYDFYGANEFNLIAAECPHGTRNYHICEANLITEVLRDGRPCQPGESGELVATSLLSHAMPFIRYRLGDEVTAGETGCPCGAPVKTLRRIDGRTADRFPLANGETIHPYVFEVPLLREASWMKRYQIVQERLDRIVVKFIAMPGSGPSAEELASLERLLTDAVGIGQVAPERVDEIPPGPGGKYRLYLPLRVPNS